MIRTIASIALCTACVAHAGNGASSGGHFDAGWLWQIFFSLVELM